MSEKKKVVEMNWTDPMPEKVNDFGKLESGNNRVRIVGNPLLRVSHYIQDATGAKRKLNCTRVAGCPACTSGNPAKETYLITILNRKNNAVQLLEVGKQVFDKVRKLATDADWGLPTSYDLQITRSGSGMQTKYETNPLPHKPLTQDEKALVTAFNDRVDARKFVEPETTDSMNEKLGNGDPKSGSGSSPNWNF